MGNLLKPMPDDPSRVLDLETCQLDPEELEGFLDARERRRKLLYAQMRTHYEGISKGGNRWRPEAYGLPPE